MKRYSQDLLAGVLIVAVNLIVFGYHSGRLGFYADDAGFLASIYPGMGFQELVSGIGSYVTGRNLHILWQYFISVVAGGSALDNLPAMHYVQVIADATTGLLLFVAFRLWRVGRPAAFVGAIAFSFYPVHDETHYWLSALPMNIMSTAFVLALVCLSAVLLHAFSAIGRNIVKLLSLVLLYFLVFLCSMFTYDQTVPVTMVTVTLVAATIFYRHPDQRILAAGAWCCCLAVFLVLVIWKIHAPAGGPVFSNLTIGHILQNLRASVGIWLSLLSSRAIFLPFRGAAAVEQVMAVAVAGVAVVATWVFLKWYDAQNNEGSDDGFVALVEDTQGLGFNLIVIVAGVGFYLLAYLPAYLWYLSPRHSYLPSVGVAIMSAGLLGALTPLAKRMAPFRAVVVLITGVLLAGFVARDLIDKESWITAFQMRKAMYQAVAERYTSENPTAFLLSGFPSAIVRNGSALGFLSCENVYAVSIMTKGKIVADAISIHPVSSQSGYFIKTEDGRWGDESFVHVARKHATVVLFEGINSEQLSTYYDAGQDRLRSDQFYSLAPIAPKSGQSAFSANFSATGYDVDVPAVSVKQDEVLALVGYSLRDGRMSSAFHSTEADMEAFVVPIDVSDVRDGAAHGFHLEYQISMPRIDSFRLYVVDGARARLVAQTPVK
jgi:hypothetical protein